FHRFCRPAAEDIAVVFRKETWEARADFSQADVHRQVAIVLRTPPYHSLQLEEPVQVEVFLQRLTDRARSRGCPYTYLPREQDAYGVKVKRKRGMPDLLEELSGADPYGIEAKRRKPPPGFMDHFAPLPAAGGDTGDVGTLGRVTSLPLGVPTVSPKSCGLKDQSLFWCFCQKKDPAQFLQVHGRACKVHLDSAVALAAESPVNMMPWQGDTNNMIDRFDVRAHLDYIPMYTPPLLNPV
ncbi:transcription factor RelB homolog, partial [Numida meleagris]|uniref:transcription factor RelB homolog n=1 Tax=Numida meleagris TaxID=8996 RepID=UPI000B3E2EBE